jgi:hypothetical protein
VRAISACGHEVASHGYAHQRLYTQPPEQFRAETRRSKGIVEDALGRPILGYRAASYAITAQSLWALALLREEGFAYDSSIFPIYHDLYGGFHGDLWALRQASCGWPALSCLCLHCLIVLDVFCSGYRAQWKKPGSRYESYKANGKQVQNT